MLQALIVDDEPSNVYGLVRHIPWAKLGYTNPLTAESGEEAVPILEASPIDVLITDVSMPGMNGIELAAEAKRVYPDIQILVISGYNEFEFAQEAIEVGAKGYVLKPLKLSEIERKLSAFRQTIERITQINEQTVKLKEIVTDSQEMLKDTFIFDLLEEEAMEEETLHSWCQLLHLPQRPTDGIQLITAVLDNYADSSVSAHNRLMVGSALQQSTSIALRELGDVLVSKIRPDQLVAIIVSPPIDKRSYISKQINFVQEYMHNSYGVSVTVGISRWGSEWQEMNQLFREVKFTIADARHSGSGQLVYVGNAERKAFEDFRMHENMLPELLMLAESDDPILLIDKVEQSFTDLERREHTFAYIQSLSISLLGELSLKVWQDSEEINFLNKRAWHRLLDCKTIDATKDIVIDYIRSAVLFERKERSLQQHHLISRIVSHMEDQLPVSITAKQLADKFHLSAGHLSVLFKKETGQTISDFVKNLRMKKAKEMLQDPTIKIYEVAERIGFQTPAYFTYQFKKNEGCTPQEYRDRYYS
ncbi:two-component system response regulator YesN [Paenibacillus sp. BK033]|uniref:response regulator transcription factor n=1 Tax=Paenibacillus sp. BK033 TaxID=2512133 RepID=UPI001044A651|nr:response regulator [Paenibacillus sp. BK033]TCN01111.1 two-component system response regulator YesN [Paenibacillus sp. BK033]